MIKLPDHTVRATEWAKVSATIHPRLEANGCCGRVGGEDGTSYSAYYTDGRGRVAALLTAEGAVIRGVWGCRRGPLPLAPRSTS
jgi:hypothetical protein